MNVRDVLLIDDVRVRGTGLFHQGETTAFTLAAVVSGIALRLASLRPGHRLDYPPVR